MKLLIATHNPAKKRELGDGFSSLLHRVSLLSLDDLHIAADPEETGTTFEDNARLKAQYFANLTGIPTVADDGGIGIDMLDGKPGVHSKRWLGYDATDEEMIAYTLQQLSNIPPDRRGAQFTVCLHYHNPSTKYDEFVKQSLRGQIALRPSEHRTQGFPYRALFIVDAYGKYYDELTHDEHDAVNHRLQAIHKLAPLIEKDLLQ